MYDMTKLKTRYFDIKLKNGKILNVFLIDILGFIIIS